MILTSTVLTDLPMVTDGLATAYSALCIMLARAELRAPN